MQIRNLSAGFISVFIETAIYMLVIEGRKEDRKRRALNFWLKWQKQQQREQTEGFLNLGIFQLKT